MPAVGTDGGGAGTDRRRFERDQWPVPEVLAGFFLYEADNLDQATELAARMPAVRIGGSIEIRPVMDH